MLCKQENKCVLELFQPPKLDEEMFFNFVPDVLWGREPIVKCRVTSGLCIYNLSPRYVYIPFSDIRYVEGMFFFLKVCIWSKL